MNNNEKSQRVNNIIGCLNSLTVQQFINVARISGMKEMGGRWRGNCPIHGGDSKSFAVYKKPEGIFYNCPTNCGSGNSIRLIAEMNNLNTKGKDFISLMNLIAERIGLPKLDDGELSVEQLQQIEDRRKQAAQQRHEMLIAEQEKRAIAHRVFSEMANSLTVEGAGLDYLVERGLKVDDRKLKILHDANVRSWCPNKFGPYLKGSKMDQILGNKEAFFKQLSQRRLIMFTHDGEFFTGFQARSHRMDSKKDYRFVSRGMTGSGFFNGQALENKKNQNILMLEGLTDCIAWLCEGDGSCLAIGKAGAGTITKKSAKLLADCERVKLVFDGDEAGTNGARNCAGVIKEAGCKNVEFACSNFRDVWEILV